MPQDDAPGGKPGILTTAQGEIGHGTLDKDVCNAAGIDLHWPGPDPLTSIPLTARNLPPL